MPRVEARETKGNLRSTSTVGADVASVDSLLHLILAGLVERLEGSPLMRRVPMQCTPEEQESLIGLLSTLSELRASRIALADVPEVDLAMVEDFWPELAALLLPMSTPPARPRSGGSGGLSTPSTQVRPPARVPAATAPAPVSDEVAFSPPRANGHAVGGAPVRQPSLPDTNGHGSRDLGEAVRVVLHTDTRPWSASRIASRIQEIDPLATRQEVYDTLYRHADLFHKTSHGWELTSR